MSMHAAMHPAATRVCFPSKGNTAASDIRLWWVSRAGPLALSTQQGQSGTLAVSATGGEQDGEQGLGFESRQHDQRRGRSCCSSRGKPRTVRGALVVAAAELPSGRALAAHFGDGGVHAGEGVAVENLDLCCHVGLRDGEPPWERA